MKIQQVYFFLIIGVLFNTYLFAQPELDTTFSDDGKSVLQFGASGWARDVMVQPDNKIVMLGGCFSLNDGSSPFCLVRLNQDGSFDTTFSNVPHNLGYVITRIPELGFFASAGGNGLAIQNDGKLVSVGFAELQSVNKVVIVRHNSNGSLDTSFGPGGIVITAVSQNSEAADVAIQPDGKILVVGTASFRQFIARYTANGTLDSSFGNGGIVILDIPSSSNSGSAIELQSSGKILTGGSIFISPERSQILTRLNYNGSVDTTFAENGYKIIGPDTTQLSTNRFISIAVQPDGRILALGNKNILYRFNPNGSLDTSFDQDGSRPALDGNADSFDVSVTASGKITVVGGTKPPDIGNMPLYYKVARYLPDGSPDTAFSNDGFLDIDLENSAHDGALAVTFDNYGRTVISGRTANGTVGNPWELSAFSLVRLIATPTQNVGFSGRVVNPDGKPVLNAFITLKLGSEIIGNARTNPFGYFHFKNIQSNQTYTLSTNAKNLNFTDRSVLVDDEVANYLIVGEQLPILIQNKK